jgi:hypothetical protein
MKHIKLNIFLFGVVVLISCSTQKKAAKNSVYTKTYNKYLSSVINDTVFFEFTQFDISDKSIYPILDSVILLSEKCQYFDTKVKYLNSFRFGIMYKNNKPLYSIDAHLSPAQAIGLVLLETGAIKQIKGIGVFYYKNYLFVIPSSNSEEQNKLKYFPFAKQTDNKLKIRAPKFFDEKVYSSYVTFDKLEDVYKLIDNEICGHQILIQ